MGKKLQGFISEHCYTCTKDIPRGHDINIDRFGGEGTAAFAAEAIRIYCPQRL